MQNIQDFICNYIQREYTVPADVDMMALNYVETGYVDSLGFIQSIALIADEYGIRFREDEMMSNDIKVVGSLIAMASRHYRNDAEG